MKQKTYRLLTVVISPLIAVVGVLGAALINRPRVPTTADAPPAKGDVTVSYSSGGYTDYSTHTYTYYTPLYADAASTNSTWYTDGLDYGGWEYSWGDNSGLDWGWATPKPRTAK